MIMVNPNMMTAYPMYHRIVKISPKTSTPNTEVNIKLEAKLVAVADRVDKWRRALHWKI